MFYVRLYHSCHQIFRALFSYRLIKHMSNGDGNKHLCKNLLCSSIEPCPFICHPEVIIFMSERCIDIGHAGDRGLWNWGTHIGNCSILTLFELLEKEFAGKMLVVLRVKLSNYVWTIRWSKQILTLRGYRHWALPSPNFIIQARNTDEEWLGNLSGVIWGRLGVALRVEDPNTFVAGYSRLDYPLW